MDKMRKSRYYRGGVKKSKNRVTCFTFTNDPISIFSTKFTALYLYVTGYLSMSHECVDEFVTNDCVSAS